MSRKILCLNLCSLTDDERDGSAPNTCLYSHVTAFLKCTIEAITQGTNADGFMKTPNKPAGENEGYIFCLKEWIHRPITVH